MLYKLFCFTVSNPVVVRTTEQAVSPLSGFAMDPASVEAKLNGSNVHVLHTKPLPNGRGSALYCSCKTENGYVTSCPNSPTSRL